MALISKPFTFSAGAVIIASQHNSDFDTVYNLVNGALDTTNLASNAAIVDTQLAQITTAGKVAGAAITLTSTTIVTADTADYAFIGDTSDSGNPKKALVSDFAYTPTKTNALSGSIIQTINTMYATAASLGSTATPIDNTIPQLTEGNAISGLSTTITPTNASNKLLIIAKAQLATVGANIETVFACYQDSTANALQAVVHPGYDSSPKEFEIIRYMTAGTTSATTFSFRAGSNGGAAIYINENVSAVALMGGTLFSSVTIFEIKA